MGLSRNKVAVPEGAAGTPPFWSVGTKMKTNGPAGKPEMFVDKTNALTKQSIDNKTRVERKRNGDCRKEVSLRNQ